jgi:acetylornithine deacetylase/succinyl-diaminopimelate desuccinylase-like protein
MAPGALAYAERHRSRFLAELKRLARFPTVSSDPRHADDLKECAFWLANHMRQIGLERVQLIPTRRHPVVYGAWQRARGRPTVLIYGHYDVVPAGPLHQWHTPPFEPAVRGDDLYGRGVCDDKGQMFAHVKALESYLQSGHGLPVNVKCLLEGEEEVGSPNLMPFIARYKDALRADVAVISDTRMLAPDRPTISYAQRGVLGLELEVRGPGQELHSGNFGGAVHNPLQVLCEMISSLHGSGGRVSIPGFYEDVRDWSARERSFMARTGPSDEQILRTAQVEGGWGERGYTLYERTTIRPALTVNGIAGGHQGPGIKAVIPPRAVAKLGFRLVPDQDPDEIARLVRKHIARITPPAVKSTIRALARAKPALVDRNHPSLRSAALAYHRGFGSPPVFVRSGGTIPVVNAFHEILGIPTVLMGFGLPDDRIHAPNEKFHLPNFYRGIATCIWFLAAAGARSRDSRRAHEETERSKAYDH